MRTRAEAGKPAASQRTGRAAAPAKGARDRGRAKPAAGAAPFLRIDGLRDRAGRAAPLLFRNSVNTICFLHETVLTQKHGQCNGGGSVRAAPY